MPHPAESHHVDCLACFAVQPAAFVAFGAWRELCDSVCCEASGQESTTISSRGSMKGAQSSTRTPKFRSWSFTSLAPSIPCIQVTRAFAGLSEACRPECCPACSNSCPFPIGAPYRASFHVSREANLACYARRRPGSETLRRANSSVAKQRVCQHVLASHCQERDKSRGVRRLLPCALRIFLSQTHAHIIANSTNPAQENTSCCVALRCVVVLRCVALCCVVCCVC